MKHRLVFPNHSGTCPWAFSTDSPEVQVLSPCGLRARWLRWASCLRAVAGLLTATPSCTGSLAVNRWVCAKCVEQGPMPLPAELRPWHSRGVGRVWLPPCSLAEAPRHRHYHSRLARPSGLGYLRKPRGKMLACARSPALGALCLRGPWRSSALA